ncbi:MAG: hypothetical protein WAQ98_23655 [Blastocatellia bacterium]
MSIVTSFLIDVGVVLEFYITHKMTLSADFGVAIIGFSNDEGKTTTGKITLK